MARGPWLDHIGGAGVEENRRLRSKKENLRKRAVSGVVGSDNVEKNQGKLKEQIMETMFLEGQGAKMWETLKENSGVW